MDKIDSPQRNSVNMNPVNKKGRSRILTFYETMNINYYTKSNGNKQLLNQGAKPFPETPWNRPFKELIETTILENPVR